VTAAPRAGFPPPGLRNAEPVWLDAGRPGTTAHARPTCPLRASTSPPRACTTVQAWVWLHVTWCPACTGSQR
jgi:hypothetical protein